MLLALALSACTALPDPEPPAEPGPETAIAAEPGYPTLATVPPRPQLDETVDQRRAILDGLIADGEQAEHTTQLIRHRAGLGPLPPPLALPAPPSLPVEAEPLPPPLPVLPREASVLEGDDGSLSSFLRQLAREQLGQTRPAE